MAELLVDFLPASFVAVVALAVVVVEEEEEEQEEEPASKQKFVPSLQAMGLTQTKPKRVLDRMWALVAAVLTKAQTFLLLLLLISLKMKPSVMIVRKA